jgi:hypothetical protein
VNEHGGGPGDHSDIRALLEHAVSDVEPRPGLDDIRARTRPRSTGRWWAAVAAAAAVAVVVAGAAVLSRPTSGPTGGPTPPPASAPATSRATLPVYFAGETSQGLRLFREHHRGNPDVNTLLAAVRLAVEGTPSDPDLSRLWPGGTRVTAVSAAAADRTGAVAVHLAGTDLRRRPSGMSAERARLAVQQVAWTVDDVLGSRVWVAWYVGGSRAQQVLGQPTPTGIGAAPAGEVLAPVQVDQPADGTTVGPTFKVRGRATAFEANVQWELVQDGTVVKRGFTTARDCCTLSPYSFRVKDVPAGTYTLVVHDEDATSGEGPGPSQDTVRVTVAE